MRELTVAEDRILEALDVRRMVASLMELVRVPSVTGTDAESELQQRQAGSLADMGFDVDEWKLDLDALRADPDFPGTEAPRLEGYGVAATYGGDGVPALALQGHVDVVPTGDLHKWPGGDPFSGRIVGDVLHGRGACDMKAGVAANLAVARAIVSSGVRLERPFAVHAVVSEEDGGLGAFATMRRGHTAEAAVITEPTSGAVVTANAGALTFAIEVPGRAAHGSTRLEGVSAFEAYLPLHRALGVLERERNLSPDRLFAGNALPYPISVGRVTSGDWASSVPDLLLAEGRLGVQLGEDPADARRALEAALDAAARADPWLRDHPPTVTWPGGQFASGRLDERDPLTGEVLDAIATVEGGRIPDVRAAPYGSDLRLYAGLGGIPTLHYGPGDVRFAHAPREQVNLGELEAVARALALLVAHRCGAHL
jgi:acetylornithine deacetylase